MSLSTPEIEGTMPAVRFDGRTRRRVALSRADLAALLLGAGLVLAMLGWLAWRMSQNVSRDRAVDARPADHAS
ncbi:MAG: hypothetical protein IT357_13100 [Gemmatimonadaceae bacterium]|nr:hypothetical protein [Gemmatimonadaceae bacterium]